MSQERQLADGKKLIFSYFVLDKDHVVGLQGRNGRRQT
jgi:hypothetical protein